MWLKHYDVDVGGLCCLQPTFETHYDSTKTYHVDPKNWCEYDDFTKWFLEIKACWNLYNKNVPDLDDFSLWVSRSNYCSTVWCIKQPRHEAGLYGECMFLCIWKLRHLLIYILHHFTSFYQMSPYCSNCIRLFCWGPIAVSFIAATWASSQSRPETRPRT